MFQKLIYACLISLCLLSCDNKTNTSSEVNLAKVAPDENKSDLSPEQVIPVTTTDETHDSSTKRSDAPTSSIKPVQPTDWTKKIVKSANVKVEVKSFKAYNQLLYTKVQQYGGYIAQEDATVADDKTETIVSIKVPVQSFDALINDLTSTTDKLIQKNIQTADVTGEVVDTKARLEAKKQMRLKYLEFLKDSKNMSEVLQVQNEVNNIQEEIESASSRYTSLSGQSAYSTINLTFFEPGTGIKPVGDPSFFTRTAAAFSTGAAWVSNLFIGLLSIWPILLVLAAGIFIYRKNNRHKPVVQKL